MSSERYDILLIVLQVARSFAQLCSSEWCQARLAATGLSLHMGTNGGRVFGRESDSAAAFWTGV